MEEELSSGRQIHPTQRSQRIHIETSLLPSKAFYFFFFSALGSINPYISLFFKQLQLSSKQTGLLVGLRPFVHCVAAPVWGIIADKINIRKISLMVGVIAWFLTYTSIVFVCSTPREKGLYCSNGSSERTEIFTDISRSNNNSLNLSLLHSKTSSPAHNQTGSKETKENFIAHFNESKNIDSFVRRSLNETINVNDSKIGTNLFLTLVLIIAFGNLITAPAQSMANLATLQAISSETHKYGQQRLFGSIGWGITSFIVGITVGVFNTKTSNCVENGSSETVNYKPCFFVFGAMMALAIVAAAFMKLKKDDARNDSSLESSTKNNADFTTIFLLVTAVYCGYALGFIETFLFWHLHDLGGTQLLFSLITGVNSFAEMVGFFFSQHVLERFGQLNVIVVGLLSSTVQMLCYGLAKNPWIVLCVEVLKSFTVSCTWSALLSYIGLRPGSAATFLAILHALYWGFGYASGGVLGGFFLHIYGAANVFLALAIFSALDACLLIIIIQKPRVCFRQQVYEELKESPVDEFPTESETE